MTTDFIEIYEHALRPELCEEIRHRFEASDRKSDGRIGHGVDKSKKNSTDITITGLSEWSDLHSQILDSTLSDLELAEYLFRVFRPGAINVQKYSKSVGGYYYWHSEIYPRDPAAETLHRVLLFMFYLNDVERGGETEFLYQERKLKPTSGTMVIAPAGFTHTHRGNVPESHDKYILSSWILFNRAEQLYARKPNPA